MNTNNIFVAVILIAMSAFLFFYLGGKPESVSEDTGGLLLETALNRYGDLRCSEAEAGGGQEKGLSVAILIDISGSMQGYSRAGGSFNAFLEKLNYSLSGTSITYYAFSNGVARQENHLSFLNPALYNAKQTDYSGIGKPLDENDFLIVVTDLQFNTLKSYDSLVRTFQGVINSKNILKFYTTDLEFDGTVYAMRGEKETPLPHNGMRPIYAVLAGDLQKASMIDEILTESGIWNHTIAFTDISCGEVALSGLSPNIWKYGRASGYPFTETVHFNEFGNFGLTVTMSDKDFLTWSGITESDIRITSLYGMRSGDSTLYATANVPHRLEECALNQGKLKFRLSMTDLNRSELSLLRFSVEPRTLPEWVSTASASDRDPLEKQKTHTYRLYDFFGALISNRMAPFTMAYAYIIID